MPRPYLSLIDESEAEGALKEEYDAAVERAGLRASAVRLRGQAHHLAAEVDQADIDALRAQGLDDATISDAIQGSATSITSPG